MTGPAGAWLPRTLAAGVALLVNGIIALAILRLVSPAIPQATLRQPPDLWDYVRVPEQAPPAEPIERRRRPEPLPPPEEPNPDTASLLSSGIEGPPAPGPLQIPVPDVRIRADAGGSGPWLGEYRRAAAGEGRGAEGYGGGGGAGIGNGGTGTGAWLPVAPSMQMQPEYPFMARRRGIEGHVLIAFHITAEGDTRDPEILESSPPGVFDDAVKRAVESWRFSVGEYRNLAGRRWQYRVVFSLRDD